MTHKPLKGQMIIRTQSLGPSMIVGTLNDIVR